MRWDLPHTHILVPYKAPHFFSESAVCETTGKKAGDHVHPRSPELVSKQCGRRWIFTVMWFFIVTDAQKSRFNLARNNPSENFT